MASPATATSGNGRQTEDDPMLSKAVTFITPNQIAVRDVRLPEVGPRDVLMRTECSFVEPGDGALGAPGALRPAPGGHAVPARAGLPEGRPRGLKVGAEVARYRAGQRVFMTTGRLADIVSGWGGHSSTAFRTRVRSIRCPTTYRARWQRHSSSSKWAGTTGTGRNWPRTIWRWWSGMGSSASSRRRRCGRGAREVWIAGRRDRRLEVASRWSADRVVNTRSQDLLAEVLAARPGGADVVVETVSQPENMPLYMQMLRPVGQLVVAGYHCGDLLTDLSPFQDKQITIHTTAGWTRPHMEATLADLVAGRLHVAPLITHRVPWQESQHCYEALVREKTEDSLGIVIDWS